MIDSTYCYLSKSRALANHAICVGGARVCYNGERSVKVIERSKMERVWQVGMRIALLAPLVAPIAPPFLGGAQALLRDLAMGLAARGHAVTLYAAKGSEVPGVKLAPLQVDSSLLTPARFVEPPAHSGGPTAGGGAGDAPHTDEDRDEADLTQPDREAFLSGYAFMEAYRLMARHASEYDLVHAHAYDWPAFAHASIQPLPIMHTLHLPAGDPQITSLLGVLAPTGKPTPTRLVTVSRACAATYAPYCRIDAVIYNGIEVARIPFGAEPAHDPYLLYAGRITPEKGVEDALEIAARAGYRLLLAGGIYDQGYFAARIAPQLESADGNARYLGVLARERLWELMAGATAVLCPSRWEEPFGLVAGEAQAAGAPVVGYARGGLREVVADGETGWLVALGDIEAAAAALARVGAIERAACRARVKQRFGLAAMLDAYEAFYRGMLAG